MKLYYLLISISVIRLIGFCYFITILFFVNLSLHLLERLPIFIDRYPDIIFLKHVNSRFKSIQSKLKLNNIYDSFFFKKILCLKLFLPIFNLYNNIEFFYLIFIDESLLMFGNIACNATNKLMSSKYNECKINKIYKEKKENENNSLLDKIKKKNEINSKPIGENMSIEDLNKINNLLSTLTGSLNNIMSDIKVDKEKLI